MTDSGLVAQAAFSELVLDSTDPWPVFLAGWRAATKDVVELLRPFAALLQPHHDWMSDDRPVFGINNAIVTLGDIRFAAARILEESRGN